VLKSELLSASIKLTLRKVLIRSVMAYACPASELATDTYRLKLEHLQNKAFRTIRNLKFTQIHKQFSDNSF
jgi:hypothetical protein